ncbi:MAG TPA: VOC family protein [Candidatus Dormibacteraeota bacterium]|nr:VOC family protein [Candidatus Dormibacteraeota bacterium]
MTTEAKQKSVAANVQQAVPFFMVSDISRSPRFYVDGLGFAKTKEWAPDGKLKWCWLELEGAALMLQEFGKQPEGKLGQGVSICFQCRDSLKLYRRFTANGIEVKEPFVGNNMWVTAFSDPDGYKLDFESPTDAPEEITLSRWEKNNPSRALTP